MQGQQHARRRAPTAARGADRPAQLGRRAHQRDRPDRADAEHVAPHRDRQRGRRDRRHQRAGRRHGDDADGHQQQVGPRRAADRRSAGGCTRVGVRLLHGPPAAAPRTVTHPPSHSRCRACGTLGSVIGRPGRRAARARWSRRPAEVGAGLARGRPAATAAQAVWHVWVDGAVHVVTGGLEQPLPVPRRRRRGRRHRAQQGHRRPAGHLPATVATVAPDDEAWDTVVAELHAKRLNPPDGEAQPARWAPRVAGRPASSRPASSSRAPGTCSHRLARAEPPGVAGHDARTAAVRRRPRARRRRR